ncbi:hypothetical protein SEA_CLUBPENGUIN_19 [Streptomyces phage ClubPenguin]|nr:hypothetical protein SEA_CLUBPENGUIN_19 [Streptomyces phage ClubPenguin]
MSSSTYLVQVHNEYEQQSFSVEGTSSNSGVVVEADMDAAVQAFANALVSGSASPYPLTLDYIRKTTTTVTDTTL